LEEAVALRRLIAEFALTHQQAAEAVGRSRAAVTNLLRLLDLTEDVQRLVRERKLDMGHARALLPLPPALQREAAQQVLLRGLSVRETEDLVRRTPTRGPDTATRRNRLDPNIRSCRMIYRNGWAHGCNCGKTSGKGRVVIHYNSAGRARRHHMPE
jgi:ParB family chromosome partitioning protein